MFSKLFGVTCIRPGCGHKNPKGAEFCESCGISLDFNRPAILDGNQWQPAPDELAAFFKFKDMKKGFFTKTLYVPGGMKAWVLQDDPQKPVLLLNEGAHTTETLFQRMNNFFRSPYGDVLVAKTGSVPLNFAFDDLRSLEGLLLKGQVSLRVRVRVGQDEHRPDLAAFRRHFMQQPGAVSAEMLSRPDVLGKSVKAALSSFVRARGVDEMAANPALAGELDAHLRNRLGALLLDLGLELLEASEFTLVHQRLDELNRQQGELWLLRREKQQEQDHARQLTDLYNTKECEALRARELDIRRKQRAGELDSQDAELAQAMRLREGLQYERVLQATNREQAARMGAADALEELEHTYGAKRRDREQIAVGERTKAEEQHAEWAHVQALARIRRDAALKLEAAKQEQELTFQRERAANALRREAADLEMKKALELANETERRAALAASVEAAAKVRIREEQLANANAEAEADAIKLAAEVKRMADERMQRLADAEADRRIAGLQRESAKEDSDDKLSKLSRLVDIDHQHELNAQHREDERLDKELDRKIKERQQQFNYDLSLKEIELRKISLTGSLPIEQLVLLAGDPHQIDALVKLATVKAHAQMTAETITASAQAFRPVSPPVPTFFAASPSAPAAPAGPSVLDEVRRTQQDDRVWMNESIHGMQAQNAQFLGVIEKMANGMRDVGVANASGAKQMAPTVVVAPVASAPLATPVQPLAVAPATPAVLQQAFVTCAHCHSLNTPSARFCSSCGQPLLTR